MLKAAILLLLLAILISLFSALYFMVNDKGHGRRMIYALYIRVGLAALTVLLIAWGFYTGHLQPHVTW